METRLSNISTNVTKLTKIITESSYIVLQVTFKWKTLKQLVHILKAVEFWPTFDIQIDITLSMFWEKLQNCTFRKPTEVSQNSPTFMSKGQPITK